MRLQNKLTYVIASVAVSISVIAVSVSIYLTVQSMKAETLKNFERDLTAKRILVKTSIEDYFVQINNQLVVMANDVSVIEASENFSKSFDQRKINTNNKKSLETYYSTQFKATFDAQNEAPIKEMGLFSQLDEKALSMQIAFIGDNEHPLGEKDALNSLNDNSKYDKLHSRYHSTFRSFLQKFGYYDIFIVEPKEGRVVYSVFKELDFATRLKNGPYKNSGISEAFNKALSLKNGETYLTDFGAYTPSYNNPASFISTPIYKNGKIVSVLIFQMPIDSINSVMTQKENWKEAGFGDSGETYLVGQDKKLRNESRFFVDDPEGYFKTLEQVGIKEHTLIKQKGSSISLQPVDTSGSNKALNGEVGFEVFNDYRNIPVLSSFGPVTILNNQWAILSEIDEAEAFKQVNLFISKTITTTVIILLIGLVFSILIAIVFAKQLTRPLNELSKRFKSLSTGEADLTARVPKSNVPEINSIGESFNTFVDQLQSIISRLKEAVDTIALSGSQLGETTLQTKKSMHQQSYDVTELKKSINQFGLSVQEITTDTKMAFESTNNAKKSAEENTIKAGEAVQEIQKLVKEVSESSHAIENLQNSVKDIGEVLTVINSIADQTNLLALNAAIEAARAGEHGRGFAVVADEVRTLASKTQESTVTIQEQIEGLTNTASKSVSTMKTASTLANSGIALVEDVKHTLEELKDNVVNIATLNENISTASQTQTYTIDFIDKNATSLEERSLEVEKTTNSMSVVAGELSAVAEEVKKDTDRFIV